MNNKINPIAATETAVRQQHTVRKDQTSEDGKFKNMLSDAVNSDTSVRNAVKPQKVEEPKAAESAGMKPQAPKAEPQTKETAQTEPQEKLPVSDEDEDLQAYAAQAASAMQAMQFTAPIITEAPQTEESAEVADIAITTEAVTAGTAKAQDAVTTVQTEQVDTDKALIPEAKAAPMETASDKDGEAQKTQTATETQTEHARPRETAAEQTKPETVETETARPEQTADRPRPIRNDRQTERQSERQESQKTVTEGEAAETQTVRPHQAVQIHNLRHSRESEGSQSKFDGLISKATRDLNPDAAAQETQGTDTAEETAVKQPITTEVKPQETVKQHEAPKAETKPQEEIKPQTEVKQSEETKPATQAAQKSVKAPTTEQRPETEISKQDEALLGMGQTKQPMLVHEPIRSEPAPQQPQQTQAPDQAEQIKMQVIKNMENQKTEFEMQLNPEELGKINVKMILESGKLSVEIMAANPKSAELLAKQAESLAASLKSGNIEVSSINVVTEASSASANMNGEYNLNNFQNRGQAHGHGGRSGRAGEAQAADDETTETDNPQAPKKILNYSV